MKIVVNDIAASTGGALEILRQFYTYVKEHDDSNEWIFLLSKPYFEETERINILLLPEVKNSGIKKLWFDLFTGHRFIENLKPDAVLSLQNIITFGVKVPQYVYIHQSIPYQSVRNFSLLKKEERSIAVYQHLIGKLIDWSAQKATGVIVQSAWMKRAVAQKTGIPESKITTAMPECHLQNVAKPEAFASNRFFCPTSDCIYKNNDLVKEACEILNERGITDFQVIMTLPQGRVRHKNIRCVGYLERNELMEEYAKSTLLFPSYIETVGLPLLEAGGFGVPIIAADCPHATDVLTGYPKAMFFDPFSALQLADRMQEMILRQDAVVLAEPIECQSGWEDVYNLTVRKI